MPRQKTISMPMTRQGVRNLDALGQEVLPLSGGPAAVQAPKMNISTNEQWISGVAGVALAAIGLSLRSIPGLALAAAGGTLIYRGVTGHCHVYAALGIDRAEHDMTREVAYLPD